MDAEDGTPLRRTQSTGDVPRLVTVSPTRRPEVSTRADTDSDPIHQQHQDTTTSPRLPTHQIPRGIPRESFSAPRNSSSTQPHNSNSVGRDGGGDGMDRRGAQQQPQEGSWISRTLRAFGIGRNASRERRTIVTLYFTLLSGFLQIIVISSVLCLAGTRLRSPTKPSLTEWMACDRPLGIWTCIWVARAILACSLTYWGFLRDRTLRQDSSSSGSLHATPSHQSRNSVSSASQAGERDRPESVLHRTRELPYAQLYSRLTLLSSLLTLTWFLTAHVLEYTSINTCRHSSPHIWWLTFSILCLMYLSVLEVVILSFVVFIIAPIVFLFWNIILIVMGRHPLQHGNMIKPEIGKLSKAVVERIPLVIYIPPPPDGLFKDTPKFPDLVHIYPPKSPKLSVSATRRRFRFIRMLPSSHRGENSKSASSGVSAQQSGSFRQKQKVNDVEKATSATEERTWEEHWEKTEYPFVVLEGNRAACAICLMDFEEPRRLDNDIGESGRVETSSLHSPDPVIAVISPEGGGEGEGGSGDELRLAEAGEGVQPLRLLECGHVFHKTCLDPWLTDVSGRCPVCQRAVVLPDTKKHRKERR